MDLTSLYDPKFTPATLAMHLDPTWVPAKHLMLISAKVAQKIGKGGARVIVSVPPRHGKSRMLSIGSTTWVLERYPKHYVGLGAYGASLSLDFSAAVRDQVSMNPDKLSVRIRAGSNRIDRWMTHGGGGVYAFGLGGPITGRGFHVFFIDDYIKEIKEALSADHLQYIWDWFVTTAMTRLEPDASVFIVATRWVEDDLIGMILQNQPEEWDYVRIPAIAEEDDPLGRIPGEALFPERYNIDALNAIEKLLGTRWFQAIYQQNPGGAGAKVARKEWIKVVGSTPNPSTLAWARVWDLAGSYRAGDFTVGMRMGARRSERSLWIDDIVRGQFSAEEVETAILETAKKDGKGVPIFIEQEPGSSGILLTASFRGKLRGYSVTGVPATTSKIARATPMLAGAEAGGVYLLNGHWVKDFLSEFDKFGTKGVHDDQEDCLAIGWNQLIGFDSLGATWGRVPSDSPHEHGNKRDPEEIRATTALAIAQPAVHSILTGATWGRRKSGLVVPKRSMIDA